ncbi:MAG: hypothetical protein ACKORE_01200 [Bacteroidota bacterium]
MIRSAIYRFLLLLLGLQLTVPAALWHGLDHHHDTVECALPSSGLSLSEAHVHCTALDLVLAVSHPESPLQFSASAEIPNRPVHVDLVYAVLNRSHSVFLRGPPAV